MGKRKIRFLLKFILALCVSLFLLILIYKIYLHFFESDFSALNAQSIRALEKIDKTEKFSFIVLGNIKNSITIFDKRLIKMINQEKPDFIIFTGNAVLDGEEDKYRVLYRSLKRLKSPVILDVGENEVSDQGTLRFYHHFGPFYFSFVADDSYFIFLDTTGTTPSQVQRVWLLEELKRAQKYRYRFVVMNKPPFTVKVYPLEDFSNQYLEPAKSRHFFRDTFSQYKITAVFSSNIAIFDKQIMAGVSYFISGGGGGGLIANDKRSFFHYIEVTVDPEQVRYKLIKLSDFSESFWEKFAENLWISVHSFFYINIFNFILVLSLIALIAIFVYIKATKEVNYYRSFDTRHSTVPDHKKLHIAMFTNTYFPFIGGVPISIARLAVALRKIGHKVYIFAPKYPGDFSHDKNVIRVKLLSYYRGFPFTNIFSRKLEKVFQTLDIDLVHVHHPYWLGVKGCKIAQKHNIPVIFTYHTRIEKYAHNIPLIGKLLENQIPHYLVKKFAQKCDAVITPTHTTKEYLRNIGVSRDIAIIPTGVDLENYHDMDKKKLADLKKQYKINNEIILLSVSRLAKEKNLYFLLEGLKQIKARTQIAFQCLIAGDGPEKADIEQYLTNSSIKSRVHLLGAVDYKEMSRFYLFSDIFIFASQSETQGMVILEAMAGSCPVVAVRSSGIEDIIHNGKNGFKTPAEVPAWADKIIDLMESAEQRNIIAENAQLFAQKYSTAVMAEKARRIYLRALRARLPAE